jgi:hypothetical protein
MILPSNLSGIRLFVLAALLAGCGAVFGGPPLITEAPKAQEDESSRDLFLLDSTYTFDGDFQHEAFGHGNSLYNDFSYDHRFLIKGNWFFRAGVEYERYDFGGTDNGLPDKLQAIYSHLAIEYVVHDRAGAGFEIDPGAYFQDQIDSGSLDIPWKLFVSFPLKKDKVFGVIGVGGGLNQHPIVGPGGGIIWLINDKMRLEGVFPKPALVYELNDKWQFRLFGELTFDSFRTEDVITPKFELHNAIVQYSEIRLGLQVRYDLCDKVKAIFAAGCNVRRNYEFFRADESATVDPAPFVKIGLEARF